MKNCTQIKASIALLLFINIILGSAQTSESQVFAPAKVTRAAQAPNSSNNRHKLTKVEPGEEMALSSSRAKSAALTSCTDKINYVGTPSLYFLSVGGNTTSPSYIYERAYFQIYPAYKGSVTAVEFNAAKFSAASSPKAFIGIFNVDASGMPVITSAPAYGVNITSLSNTTYTCTFPNPISVTGNYGFAVVVFTNNNDSIKCFTGPILSPGGPYMSFVSTSYSPNLYTVYNWWGDNFNILMRPIVTTTVNPTWLTAKTSTGCGAPAVYNFTNTTGPNPSYVNNQYINPSGMTKSIDFGDGSPVLPFNGVITHSYTTLGTYTAGYTQTYVGWTNNCVETSTLEVIVDSPKPDFTYTINGMNVIVDNTSQDMSSFLWNFGDLATSTSPEPGSHLYTSPGTYVIELEGNSACGKVRYNVSVVVPGTVGVEKHEASQLLSVFPNPATDHLQITGDNADPRMNIEILNTLGASVKTINNYNTASGSSQIDISGLPKGMYFVKAQNSKGTVVKSFIKD